ncbi:MAG: desulfoferrodoxin [Clostridia bacterium]|nr:desulfoferrodoxin [Clostridia bacterium]
MKELVIKKCKKCGATVEILKDCTCNDCGILCCGEKMETMLPNSVDASIEKHLPQVEVFEDYIVVKVPHVMEENHYIEFIAIESDKISAKKYFKPFEEAKAVFPYIKGATVYSKCNIHGIWSTKV